MAEYKHMDEFLGNLVNDGKRGPAGCGCIVARDGEILFENYYGYADLASKKPITADSVFRQYSTTKVAVCTGAMMLYERGKFLLNDPISEYFPEWKDTMVAEEQPDGTYVIRPAKRPIQVKDCFSMAMGIGYGGSDYTHQMAAKVRKELAETVGDYTLRQDIHAMSKVPVRFDPGTHWLYGFGHELVAGLIEVTSGMKVSEFLKQELFEPLGMNHTGYHYFADMRENMVTPYNKDENGVLTVCEPGLFDARFEPESKYEAGGAGLFSSVRDYSAMAQMLACGGMYKGQRIMGRKTIDLMRTNQLNDVQMQDCLGDFKEGYGYGLGVRTHMFPGTASNSSMGEFGWTGMMGTYVAIDPTEKASVVYMHNMLPNEEFYIHRRVRNIGFGMIK